MGSSSVARVTAALLVVVLAAVPAMATDYTVGDSSGWTQGVDYSTWASGKTFTVGDTLTFQYGFLHSVDEVSKSDYDGCSSSNAIQSYTDQNTQITLSKPGNRYFICGTSGHCTNGMKLAVPIVAASASTGPTTPASNPTTPTSTTTPSSSTPTETPNTTPSTTPVTNSPSSKNTPTTTSGSSRAAKIGGNIAVMVGMSLVGAALL